MPINQAPLEEDDKSSLVWLRWFADLADSLEGDWDLYTQSLPFTGTGSQTVNIQGMGATKFIQIQIDSTTSGSLTLPFTAKNTILEVWDSDTQTLIGGASVNGKIIQLPTTTTNILIKGMVILWTR